MKMSKKVWLIVGIGVFAIVIAVLFSTYSRQAGEREQLENNLFTAQALLPKLTNQKGDLENQLAQAQSLLDRSRAKFPKVLESIEYGEDFFKIAYGQNLYALAGGCGVDLTRLTASLPTDKKVGAVTYSVSSFVVAVDGNIDDILKFIDAIGTGINYKLTWSFQLPWSVDVKSVNMNIASGTATAIINLDIYAYKGE